MNETIRIMMIIDHDQVNTRASSHSTGSGRCPQLSNAARIAESRRQIIRRVTLLIDDNNNIHNNDYSGLVAFWALPEVSSQVSQDVPVTNC